MRRRRGTGIEAGARVEEYGPVWLSMEGWGSEDGKKALLFPYLYSCLDH